MHFAAAGLAAAGASAVLVGGRATVEDAYAYSKFARIVLGSDNLDFRARASSTEETEFLAAHVAAKNIDVTYSNIETASQVFLVGFEPEDESPIVFLRLRKSAKKGLVVHTVGPLYSLGSEKLSANWIKANAGSEAQAITGLDAGVISTLDSNSIIFVGERAASSPGVLSAVSQLGSQTGARIAWVPRRAGERGALDAGALAGLLPGGRPISDSTARAEVAQVWNTDADSLPNVGLTGTALVTAIAQGSIKAVITAGVDPSDLPNGTELLAGIDQADFVVALENHHSEITQRASVVFPVAVVTEKSGSFMNWEGRSKPFSAAFREALTLTDAGVLSMLASAMDVQLNGDTRALRKELNSLQPWSGSRTTVNNHQVSVSAGTTLATWRLLIDSGVMQEGEPHLAATARPSVAVVNAAMFEQLGAPELITVTGPKGSITLPAQVAEVSSESVWLPMNSPDSHIYAQLGCGYGDEVSVKGGAA
jgi:NADH-quinone oxidoreductase subunit G